jgi:tetratricopeptide (TPR) repeat protein
MKGDSRRLGIWLAGSGLSFAALYLIGAAPVGHAVPVFPYWIFLTMFVAGGALYVWPSLLARLTPRPAGAVAGGGEPPMSNQPGQHEAAVDAGNTPALVAGSQVVVGEIPREPPGFVAREMVDRLANAAERGPIAVVCAVTGMRGVGKTQVAAAYARARIAEGWGLVGWVGAETADGLLAGLNRVAERLGVSDPEGDSAESARRLREHLNARAGRGLLVFDNAADPDGLRLFLPAAGGTQVVVTSTDRSFVELGEVVDISVFSRAESLGFLRARTGLGDETDADAVAAELGDLPLGLAQAAATIRSQHLTYREYLGRLRGVPVAKVLGRIPGGDYAYATAAALLLSVQMTEEGDRSGLAGRLLRVIAVLSPDGVPRPLLEGVAGEASSGMGLVDVAAEWCVAGSLLTWSVTGEEVIMHRLLGRVLRERDQATGQWNATVNAALGALESRLFPTEDAWARRQEGAELIAQIEALWDVGPGSDAPVLSLRLLQIRSWAVRQLLSTANLSRAIDLGTQVLADCERLLGDDQPQTLTARLNLASVYWAARKGEAIGLAEVTLADHERVLGRDHPDTIYSRLTLAFAYEGAGQLDEAIGAYEVALADSQQVLGEDHPQTLLAQLNLADAYQSTGRLDEAITLLEATLTDSEQVLGHDHPQTLATQGHLALSYQAVGRLDEAIELYKATLADRERVIGRDHPDSLGSKGSLARAYQVAGRLSEAIGLYEATLADCERVLGHDHPRTRDSRGNLAGAYQAVGRLSEAIGLYEATLADCERVLGHNHPDTRAYRKKLEQARAAARLHPPAKRGMKRGPRK